MAAGIFDIEIPQGSSYGLDLTFKDEDGSIRPLFGYVARSSIRTYAESTEALDTWSTTTGEITVHDEAPNLRLTVGGNDTALYPAGEYVYDLEIELNGVVEKVLQGNVNVIVEVTR
jgi:hypothetical protein